MIGDLDFNNNEHASKLLHETQRLYIIPFCILKILQHLIINPVNDTKRSVVTNVTSVPTH